MKRLILAACAAAALLATPALASLKVGVAAPEFKADASLAGEPYKFDLNEALKKGPVVLYFFPAAFTQGCTIEAHEFADASDDFTKLGATVIGVTSGNIERVAEFSKSECRNKFAVAADPGLVIAGQYDAKLAMKQGYSDRTTYVITPDHKVALAYTNLMDPSSHITKAMETVKAWRAAHPMKKK
ncbi:MAG: Peroxiredoxin [Caulobacter sp.]|nr:Peroxiredoxin [Caulobacter sp.]